MIQLKVGDFVKIREDLIDNKYYPSPIIKPINTILCVSEMITFGGKIAKITGIYEDFYIRLNIDNETFNWAESMLYKFKPSKEDLFELYLNNKIDKEKFEKLKSTL